MNNSNVETIVFGGGCFWCTEAVFKMLRGVVSVLPGYSGGIIENPTYEQVCNGDTGHVEVVKVDYDPKMVDFETLLTIFFVSHDPTTKDRQGNDVGSQYRPVIFYTTDKQKEETKKFIERLNSRSNLGRDIVTEVVPLNKFYEAENYHRDYYENHKEAPYCAVVINPKLEKIQKQFAELLNNSA